MLKQALNVAEVRERARRTLPRGMFEFIDRGTEDENGLAETHRTLAAVKLRPSVLVDIRGRNQETELLGTPQPSPLIVAPTGLAGLMWYQGEVELARAAAKAGIPFCVSTQSITSVEDIAAKAGGRLWFQLYILRDRAITRSFVDRAEAAGAEALIVTVDTVVSPKREYNTHNGFGIPFNPNLRGIVDLALHPRWLASVLGRYLMDGGIPTYPHYPPEFRRKITRAALTDAVKLADDVTWDEIAALRQRWPRKLIIKGILRADDARRAAALGADAIVVSNHGGRNLDAAVTPVEAMPEIIDAVGSALTVLADSGVRRGSDVVKLLGLGAKGVLVGRSILFGTAVAGEAGASHVLDILRDEIDRTMAFIGRTTIAGIGPDTVSAPSLFGQERHTP